MKTLQFAVLCALLSLGACTWPWSRLCALQGQDYSSCAPSAPDCVPTCENPKAACKAPCKPGCRCPSGQVLDTKSRRCVRRDLCPQVICFLAPEVGFCDGYIPRYFYNPTSSQCEKFIYGGCSGNDNNFVTPPECQQKCGCSAKGQQFFNGVDKCVPCVGTCENPRPICPLACTRGCACPLGTVLDTEVNACVSAKQCPTGQTCSHSDGAEIEDGDSYKPNPCTHCHCDNGKLICVVKDCAAPSCNDYTVPPGECCPVCPEPTVCHYNGQTYQPGESFPSSDGCNTCFCSENGFISCTEIACLPKLVCPKPTGSGICVDLCVPGFACGPGQKCCSNGCGHMCTNATNCAPVDCAPTLCDFPGGVVIPAGEDECCPTCGCMSGGTTYRVGESFPAGDGCNTCSCTPSGILCTLIACMLPEA